MKTEEMKVGRINLPQGASLGDQLALLKLRRELSERKREEATTSKDSAERLQNIENLVSQILDELVAIRVLLESSSGEIVSSETSPRG